MNKFYLIFFVTMISTLSYSQSYFINLGKNSSEFKFTTPYSKKILSSDIGDAFGVGYCFDINNSNTNYEIAFTLNKFNPYVGSPDSEVKYSLNYLGVDNAILYPIIGKTYRSSFILLVRASLSCNKLISGIESIEGEVHNLRSFPEFKGLLFMGALGLQSKVIVSHYINLSLGYNHGFSFLKTGQLNKESLTISNNQFVIGINFILQNKNNIIKS